MADTQDEAGEIVRELRQEVADWLSVMGGHSTRSRLLERAAAFITTQRGVEATEDEISAARDALPDHVRRPTRDYVRMMLNAAYRERRANLRIVHQKKEP